MKTIQRNPERAAVLAILICTSLLAWSLALPAVAFAQEPPTPPPPPPTRTPTPTPAPPTDTPAPTDTPVPTDTPLLTDTPVPTETPVLTDTPAPTETSLPANTAVPTPTPAGPEGTPGPQSTTSPNPDCQSVVEGSVLDASGGPARGATVIIEGADWSDAMLSNDTGQYGFARLCPGLASVQAFLTDGKVSQLAELDLNGRDTIHVELSVASAQAGAGESSPEQAVTPGPDMPATGNEGWMLLGAALLAAFLLLVAGARRVMTVRERNEGRD